MKEKNVLHIITVSFVINHFFGNQFNYLKSKTGNQYFLGCSDSKEFRDLSKVLGYVPFKVEVTRKISPITDLKSIIQIYKFIKRNEIDVVVGHTPKGGMVAMIASYLAGVKKRIYFRHGIIYETSKGLKRILLKLIDKLSGTLATKVVCVSESVKKISIEDRLNSVDKNIILGKGTCNGIDTEKKYNPTSQSIQKVEDLRNSLGIGDNEIVIGYVGRLVKDKGINELVSAYKIISKKYPHTKLLLVGPIEERDPIDEAIKQEINTNDKIINTGFVLNSSPYFSLMDMFILPTYREGFPTVSLEASSMGLPVLITKATGCQEAILENETGIFIKNTINDISDKIEIYLNDDKLRKKHGEQGREFVRTYFEETKIWDIIHEQLHY